MEDVSVREVNNAFFGMLERGMVKEAQSAVTDFFRVKLREEGFLRKIGQPIQVTDADLVPQVDTDKPTVVIPMEPDSPAAYSVPFGTLPMSRYIKQKKVRVMFQRLETPRFVKDINELRTSQMDIRQVLSDNRLKDMQAEEDRKAIATIEAILIGVNQVVPDTNQAQWTSIAGGITRETWNEAMKTLPSTPARFPCKTILINHVTILEFQKWGRDEIGGDMAEQIASRGWGQTEWFGKNIIVTIKNDLVPNNRIYQFAEPKAALRLMLLEDVTMFVETRAFMVEWFAYESIGAIFPQASTLAITDFTGSP